MNNELFKEDEMKRIPSDSEIFEYALEISEDFKPKAYFENKEIDLIWFNPYQLDLLVKFIKTGSKKK